MLWTKEWKTIKDYKEIKFEMLNGVARISINRPEKHNAFTPLTVQEMIEAMTECRYNDDIHVILLAGEGGKAFAVAATRVSEVMAVMLVTMRFPG